MSGSERETWMASLLYQTIEQISREKHIEPEIIVAAIEDAMVVAARKYYRTEEDLRSKFNPDTGQIDVFSVHTVVEEVADPLREISLADARKQNPDIEVGGEITEAKPTDVLGRIAAQTAKQVILQKVREAERDTIYNEFHTRVGELVNSIVKRTEGPDLIVDLGRTEARLPKREQSRLEAYNVGDRLRVTIRAVERAAKGPQVVVSRADPALVQRLFEMEVPEIYDGTVQIRAVAREAGERTKIAVESRDKDVDPVGACVGMKGMRVQSIIRELRGEKIDIIPVQRRDRRVRAEGAEPRESDARADRRSGRKAAGSDRRGYAAFAGHRQEGPERAAGQQADRLEHRYQERGRKAPRNRSADGGAHRSRHAADGAGGRGAEDDRETGSGGHYVDREAGGHDARNSLWKFRASARKWWRRSTSRWRRTSKRSKRRRRRRSKLRRRRGGPRKRVAEGSSTELEAAAKPSRNMPKRDAAEGELEAAEESAKPRTDRGCGSERSCRNADEERSERQRTKVAAKAEEDVSNAAEDAANQLRRE